MSARRAFAHMSHGKIPAVLILLVVAALAARRRGGEQHVVSQAILTPAAIGSSSGGDNTSGSSGNGSGSTSGSRARCMLASCSELTAEEARWQAQPRYSTFTCLKGHTSYGSWRTATCAFHNICLNTSTMRFEYYIDPELPATPVMWALDGKPMFEFPDKLVDTGGPDNVQMPWHPNIVRRAFPQEGPRVKWAPAPQALLYSLCHLSWWLPSNFGHVLYDVMVPLFNMQHMFGVYTPRAMPLAMGCPNAEKEERFRNILLKVLNNPRPELSMLQLHWDHNMTLAADLAVQVLGSAGDGLVCFRTVLAGASKLNRRGPAESRPYRDAAVWRLGLREDPQQRPTITVLHKEGPKRHVENSADIVAALEARYGKYVSVVMTTCCNKGSLTLPEQVKLMSDTSVLITPGGGLAAILNFLRPSATALPFMFWNTVTNTSGSLDWKYYPNMDSPRIVEFPMTLSEYEGTSDMPGCKQLAKVGDRYKRDGWLVHCNLRFGPKAMQRLMQHVDAALLHWAERNGRYDVLEPLRRAAAAEKATN